MVTTNEGERLMVSVVPTGYVPIVNPARPRETDDERNVRLETALRRGTSYLLHSARTGTHEGDRHIFTGPRDDLSLAQARDALRSCYGARAAFHRIALSPHSSLDVRGRHPIMEWTRRALEDTERWMGVGRWVWIGAAHGNTGIWHAHVIVAGRTRGEHDVILKWPAFQRMREAGQRAAMELSDQSAARYKRLYALGLF